MAVNRPVQEGVSTRLLATTKPMWLFVFVLFDLGLKDMFLFSTCRTEANWIGIFQSHTKEGWKDQISIL